MSWANEICGADAEERAVVLGVMNAAGYGVHTWLPVLTYPIEEGPRFKKGFAFSVAAFVAQFTVTGVVFWLWRREEVKKKWTRSNGNEYDSGILIPDPGLAWAGRKL